MKRVLIVAMTCMIFAAMSGCIDSDDKMPNEMIIDETTNDEPVDVNPVDGSVSINDIPFTALIPCGDASFRFIFEKGGMFEYCLVCPDLPDEVERGTWTKTGSGEYDMESMDKSHSSHLKLLPNGVVEYSEGENGIEGTWASGIQR